MARHADTPGSLALSPRPRSAARASVLPRATQPAEVAQARVFEGLLQAEFAELQELEHRIAGILGQLPGSDISQSSRDLMQIRARIDEVHSLLQALQGRFPHFQPVVDR
ncbi:MAG: hypothetical protein WBZ15_12430 [Mycobacterium sp.]|uniref:hypothetical protein n=1 Tax=Mycobacterium sp. TaxID=1785 RepID=UPI003C3F8935